MSPELSHYENREQAWVKHWLLEKYLEELFLKVGRRWNRIVYIDAFAGPWGANTTDLSDTSFDRAVKVMRRCRDKLAADKKYVQFDAYFLDKDRNRAERLIAYAKRESRSGVTIKGFHLDFTKQIEDIALWLTDQDFAFVLIDPLGYKTVTAPGVLAPLLRKRGVELMINLMFDHINRFLNTKDQALNMQEIFGVGFEGKLGTMSGPREHRILRLYCERLREQAETSRVWSSAFPVEYPHRDRTYYYLVYASHEPTGLLTFGKVAEKAGTEQVRTKSTLALKKKGLATGTLDMFGVDGMIDEDRFVDEDAIQAAWLRRLPVVSAEIIVCKTVMAEIIEECMCLESDVQRVLKKLIGRGILRNASTTSRRPINPVHPEKKERIRRES